MIGIDTMKNTYVIIVLIFIVLLCGCSFPSFSNKEQLQEEIDYAVPDTYPPLIYVNDRLYQISPRDEYLLYLSENIKMIGTITKAIPQNECPKENFVANSDPIGTEIYYDDEKPEEIYAKIIVYGETRYFLFISSK